MRARFTANLTAAIAGAVLVASAFAFVPATSAWIGLGIGCLAVTTALSAFAARGQGATARTIDVLLAVAGAWTIVASRVLGAGVTRWLSFADGAAICMLGLLGLIVHEAVTERELRSAVARPVQVQPERAPLSPAPPQMRRTAV